MAFPLGALGLSFNNKTLFKPAIPAYTHVFTRPDTLGGSRIIYKEYSYG